MLIRKRAPWRSREFNDGKGAGDSVVIAYAVQAGNTTFVVRLNHVDTVAAKSLCYAFAVEKLLLRAARQEDESEADRKQQFDPMY